MIMEVKRMVSSHLPQNNKVHNHSIRERENKNKGKKDEPCGVRASFEIGRADAEVNCCNTSESVFKR